MKKQKKINKNKPEKTQGSPAKKADKEIKASPHNQDEKASIIKKFRLFKKKKKEVNKNIQKQKNVGLKKKKHKKSVHHRKHRFTNYLYRAGIETHPKILARRIFNITILITLLVSFYIIFRYSQTIGFAWNNLILAMLGIWLLVFFLLLAIIWVFFYFSIDLRIFKRNQEIEEVLPDFLQLTASNIKAGMTIDSALWYAVRPRFGVLAKDIEVVAKETMAGKDLRDALSEFTSKYNSQTLKRSFSLLLEGMDAGGEIGDLLIRIATNIQETKIMKQEMAASVTTYVIFISFAILIAAPFLFSLSGILVDVIQTLGKSMGDVGASSSGLSISFSGNAVKPEDFRTFAIVTLIISSFFSASVIATIKKGTIKAGLKYIPIFITVSVLVYFLGDYLFSGFMGTFF